MYPLTIYPWSLCIHHHEQIFDSTELSEPASYISPLPGGAGGQGLGAGEEEERDFVSLSLQPIVVRIPKGTPLESIQVKIAVMGVAYGGGKSLLRFLLMSSYLTISTLTA